MATYLLRDCVSGETELLDSGDLNLSVYIGKIIRVTIEGVEGTSCVEVVEASNQEAEEVQVTVIECFQTCEECLTPSYELQDCSGRYGNIYSLDVNLEDFVGNVIRVPYFDDTCFEVSSVPYSKDNRHYRRTEISGSYDDCESCKIKIFTDNQYAPLTCDITKMEHIKCTFADLIWEKIIARRFEISFCCPVDSVKYTIKNEITNNDLMNDPTPPLPEPEVLPCCIVPTSTCNTNPCSSCNTVEIDVENCVCEASSDSPHPCHNYTIGVTEGQIMLAIGNTNPWYNGKVFFAYFACGNTKPTVVEIEEETQENFCVLGIPVFGYFSNNEFIYLENLVRGAICEELPVNNCCND
jgi:hypothetical protein